jgi:hypothetical protein
MYGVIGRLAMLSASYELEATDPDAESTTEGGARGPVAAAQQIGPEGTLAGRPGGW